MEVEISNPNPSTLAAKIRSAVSAQDYRKAELLLAEYCQRAQVEIKQSSTERRSDLLRELRDLLNWAQTITLSNRALDVNQLEAITTHAVYDEADAANSPSWQFDA
jgi:hypothetical protein